MKLKIKSSEEKKPFVEFSLVEGDGEVSVLAECEGERKYLITFSENGKVKRNSSARIADFKFDDYGKIIID